MDTKKIIYKPIQFIIIAFLITWICAFFQAFQIWFDYNSFVGRIVLRAADFVESASPLLTAIFLLRKNLFQNRTFAKFILGEKPRLIPYIAVLALFIYQFITFYFFRMSGSGTISLTAFLSAWVGQILLGGGMEEGGWRGYLQPSFEKRVNAILSVVLVAVVWAFWHLPYFFLPGTFQSGNNFFFYMITTTATAFTLTAIYKLTGSILLCTLFHGWQNAIVMNIPANMGHPGFLIMFALQTIVSIVLCVKLSGKTLYLR